LISAGLKRFIIYLFLLFCACPVYPQNNAAVQRLTVNDGLSQGMIFDILQSREGFIWIATKDGLNRYDGTRFEVFSPDPFNPFAIGNSEAQALFEDSRGWIWITLPDGLDVFEPVSRRFFHVKQQGKPIPPGSIAETQDGTIWLSDRDQIWKITVENNLLTKAAGQNNPIIEPPCKTISMSNLRDWSGGTLQIEDLLFTQNKKLLLGTNQGLFRLDPTTEQILPELPFPNCRIKRMAESKAGELLLIGDKNDGHKVWIRIAGEKVQYREDDLLGSHIVYDDAGFFWASANRSIQRWKPSVFFGNGKPELEIPQMENNLGYAFTYFMKDKSDLIWVGTSGYGIVKINEKGQKFKTILPGTAHRMLFEDPRGALYISGVPDKKFLSKSFDKSAPNTEVPISGADGCNDFVFDAAGNFWMVRTNKPFIYRKDAITKTEKSFPFEGIALLYDRNGKLIGVNDKGLHRFDPATETSQDFPFDNPQKQQSPNSRYLYEDSEGVIWIFGFDGLTKAVPIPTGYRYEQYLNNPADRNSLSINIVQSVADDPLEPRRYLWVGTKGGGLNRLDKQSGQFKQYTKAQGLPDNVVYGILAEDLRSSKSVQASGYIWMSTNKGLCRFDVRTETTKNFTVADGLQDNEFNSMSYLKTRDGYLIFGGVNGINAFHPDSLRSNENVPQIHIVGLQVNNRKFDISGKSTVALSHDQNLLTFEFAALEFTNPAQNQYRYQLVGVDKDWVALGARNSAQFANLAPGDYTFKVEGSNNDGAWSGQPAELHFTIRPPWYGSWWAFVLYISLAATGIWWYYQYLLRQRFSEQEKLRLRELDDFKSRFFTNITHEFRTPLTVILGMTDRMLSDGVTQSHPVTLAQPLALIKRSGENLLRLVNQILDLSKLESNALKMNYIQGDILAFIRYVAESMHSLANVQNLMLRVESDQAKIVMDYDPERFLQIIHNLLSNAVKFTPSGGKVVLRANMEGQWLHVAVTDTGVGIPAEELPHLFERFFQAKNQEYAKAGGTGIGLSLTRELVKAMGGEIGVESTPGVGTTFWVKLPVTNNSNFDEQGAEGWKVPGARQPAMVQSFSNDPDGHSILLIEDNPDVVEYLNACLQGAGDREGRPYQLDFAYNGQAGIEKAFETVPDLIVSDVMMPFKDGFEVVEALKNDERTSHIPIILLTARADVQSRLTGLRRGADAYLSKPFHQEELLVTLENLLELRRKLQLKYQQNVLAVEVALPVSAASDPEDAFLQQVRAIIEANYPDDGFGLPQLCQKIGMSRSQLFRKMKALTDLAPSDLIRSHRLNKAKMLLESGTVNVAEAAWQVGFKDPSYFSKLYQEEFGEAPSTTRK
jgi:signal transduction histidine kinase/AraC-like DNA-binding protein/ActR/RegA family two-component response regulator